MSSTRGFVGLLAALTFVVFPVASCTCAPTNVSDDGGVDGGEGGGTSTGGGTETGGGGGATGGGTTGGGSAGGGGGGTGGASGGGLGGGGGSIDCSATEKLCNGVCVNIADPAFGCGATTCTACAPIMNATVSCAGMQCALGTCDPGRKNCDANDTNGCEVDSTLDPLHCGTCSNACALPHSTSTCSASTCTVGTCEMGWTDCNMLAADGCEVSLPSDPLNCGMCGRACSGAEQCRQGVCGLFCTAGLADCNVNPVDGCETMLNTDLNCAFCGNACTLANSTSSCAMGACGITTCNPGFADCDSVTANGCETNTQTSATNCATCGTACPSGPHSTPVCSTAACSITCEAGYSDCDGDPLNGCEIHTDEDLTHCGTCPTVCSTPNGEPACLGGNCAVGGCDGGFADCDLLVPNGCETDTLSDIANCNACGTVCPLPMNGAPACNIGVCGLSCAPGFFDCNMNASDGCEVNGTNDAANCNACGNVCSYTNGTPSCTNSVCGGSSCSVGFADCNGLVADGCEINTTNSATNCATCGNTCSAANASTACNTSTCGITSCNAGFSNCDGAYGNGCEINTNTNPSHCGGCGNICNLPNAVSNCTAGLCTIASCNAGFSDCDGQAANGCEVNTQSSTGNCGGCGNVCNLANATAACISGQCTVASCNGTFRNCNGVAGDGCEINSATSVNNCGFCGQQCFVANGTAVCSSSTCAVASCNAGFGNCNGSAADGCERNLQIDPTACGGCGVNCATTCVGNVSSVACGSGTCQVTACVAPYYNVDNLCSGGCECRSSGNSQQCSTPQSLGTLQVGQSTSFTGNLVPSGTVAWLTVTFAGNTNIGYHPRVRLTSNPNAEFVLDVMTNCSGSAATCGIEGGVSTSRTDWEIYYSGGDSSSVGFNAIPAINTVLVRVSRRVGAQLTCNNFVLSVTN